MFCPKCGKAAQAGAAFCMYCGQSLATAGQPAVHPIGIPAPAFPKPHSGASKKTTWIAIGTALAMILALFFGLRASGLLQFGAKSPKLESLRAEGQSPQIPLLRAEGSTGPPTLQQPAQKVEMPLDVRRWLEHLEKIEERKNELTVRQASQMQVFGTLMKGVGAAYSEMLAGEEGTSEPSSTVAKKEFEDLKPEWNQIIADFQSLPPPAECAPIRDDYFRALNEIPGMTDDIAQILNLDLSDHDNIAKALTSVRNMQNKSGKVVDRYFKDADGKLSGICRKYETRKWFDIDPDPMSGGIFGKTGGSGLGL